MIFTKQFETYKKDSVVKGNKPEKDGKKIWIDWVNKYAQFGINTIDSIDDVSWFPYTAIKMRKGVILIKTTDNGKCYIKLNLFERFVKYCIDHLTNIMAWIGGISGPILIIKDIFI